MVAAGAQRGWDLAGVDVKTAFLQVPPGRSKDIVVVNPPTIFQEYGITEPGELWAVEGSVYGLTTSPKDWAKHRDQTMGEISWEMTDEEGTWSCWFEKTKEVNLWRVKSRRWGKNETIGYMAVYIDDMLVTGARRSVEAVLAKIRETWDTSIAGALLAYRTGPDQDVFTTNQITSALVAYRSAADRDTATASSIAAALLSYYTIAQVDGLFAGKLGVTEAASALQIAVRFPDDGGADEVVAAIGEQILGPTDVSLSNWTVRPSSGCSVVLATHTAGAASVDGYTLTLAVNPWNIVRTYNLTPGLPRRI